MTAGIMWEPTFRLLLVAVTLAGVAGFGALLVHLPLWVKDWWQTDPEFDAVVQRQQLNAWFDAESRPTYLRENQP